MADLYSFQATSLDGFPVDLSNYRGKVVLVVNTASECGFTPQYKGLETLFVDLQEKGLVILGFPCNQFGGQEPGSAQEIGAFCEKNYGVTFPLFEKIDVNGADAHPLFRWLKSEAKGILGTEAIKWNFTKFLIDRHGNVVKRFAPNDTPESLRTDIERLLD